jgi:type IV secretory pathway VirJ component
MVSLDRLAGEGSRPVQEYKEDMSHPRRQRQTGASRPGPLRGIERTRHGALAAILSVVLAAGALAMGAPGAFADSPAPCPDRESHRTDLPVIEVPARCGAGMGVMAILLTGDGGYGAFNRRFSQELAAHGIPVVAVSSLKYFWHRRDPDEAARDVERLLDLYLGVWQKDRAILIGHSMGADVLPFIVSRMTPDARKRVDSIALLGPALSVDFKFHLSYWFAGGRDRYPMSVKQEVAKLDGSTILCVHGEQEKHSLCPVADSDGMQIASVSGGHHFKKHSRTIADMIVDRALEPDTD